MNNLVILAAILVFFLPKGAQMLGKNLTEFDSIFQSKAKKYGLDWKMLKAIADIESSLGQAIKDKLLENAPDSFDGLSAGLMQMTLTTARDYDPAANWLKLKDPEYSIELAARHIAKLKTLAESLPIARQTEFIVKSYNQGQGNTKKEFQGKSTGFAAGYWQKYLVAYEKIS